MNDYERGVQDAEDVIAKAVLEHGPYFWKHVDLLSKTIAYPFPEEVTDQIAYLGGFVKKLKSFTKDASMRP